MYRGGGISCDNKGERLIHKKKKSGWWRVQPPSGGGYSAVTAWTPGRTPVAPGQRPRPRRTREGNASGEGEKNPKRDPATRRLEGGVQPGLGTKTGTGPAPGCPEAPPAERREHCSLRARGPGTRVHAHPRARAHIHIYTHTQTYTAPCQLAAPHAPAAHASDPP